MIAQAKQLFIRLYVALRTNPYGHPYSLRITQARRATAYREGQFIRLLTIADDHDSTYGKK